MVKEFDRPPLLEISLQKGLALREKLKEKVTVRHSQAALDFFDGFSMPSSDLV